MDLNTLKNMLPRNRSDRSARTRALLLARDHLQGGQLYDFYRVALWFSTDFTRDQLTVLKQIAAKLYQQFPVTTTGTRGPALGQWDEFSYLNAGGGGQGGPESPSPNYAPGGGGWGGNINDPNVPNYGPGDGTPGGGQWGGGWDAGQWLRWGIQQVPGLVSPFLPSPQAPQPGQPTPGGVTWPPMQPGPQYPTQPGPQYPTQPGTQYPPQYPAQPPQIPGQVPGQQYPGQVPGYQPQPAPKKEEGGGGALLAAAGVGALALLLLSKKKRRTNGRRRMNGRRR